MSSEAPQTLFEGLRFRVERIRQTTADGRHRVREVVRHPGAVVVLPLIETDRVCLIRQYRAAVGETLIELPAGTLEPGEDPRETALRELAEETGYRAASIEQFHDIFPSPGILDERMRLYLATGLTEGQPHREMGEEIDNLVIPLEEAVEMAVDGRIKDAKTIVALLCYDRQRRGRQPA